MPRAESIVLVNTGHGKGKSSAAFGVMGRAWARGWRVGHFPTHQRNSRGAAVHFDFARLDEFPKHGFPLHFS